MSRSAFLARNAELAKIIQPLPAHAYELHTMLEPGLRNFDTLFSGYGPVNFHPDFQRGHVWTENQQREFITACLRGTVDLGSTVISFNIPHWEDMRYAGDLPREIQCIDGLQRVTAVRRFINGEITASCGLSESDLSGSSYHLTGKCMRVRAFAFRTKRELLTYYLDLNTGGTVHSGAEIERVAAMRDAC